MKKLISGLIIGGLLATSVCTYAEEATSWRADLATFNVMVRGEKFVSENPPIVVEGRTYLPLRAMGEALNVPVEWNADLKQAEVAMSDKKPEVSQPKASVELTTTTWTAYKATFKVMVRGSEFISENPPIVVEGRTYLPLRALGDALGVPVEWNADLKQAEVDMKSTATPTPQTTPKPSATPLVKTKIGTIDAKAATTIDIPIKISFDESKALNTFDVALAFDGDVFEFVDIKPGDIITNPGTNFEGNHVPDGNLVKILFLNYDLEDAGLIKKSGDIATLRLKAKTDVVGSEFSLAGKPTFGDANIKKVEDVNVTIGDVTVVQ